MLFNVSHRDKPIKGSIYLPGDKSIAQRAILLSAIAQGKSILRNMPLSDDCLAVIRCIKELGVSTDLTGSTLVINGRGLHGLCKPSKPLNVSESGTAARLLTGFLAGQSFPSVITGKKTLLTRPMKRVIEPLRKMGARIESKDGKLPLYIYPSKLNSIEYTMPVASAQVKSAILLAGLYAKGKTIIYEPIPTRDHTERLLYLIGARIKHRAKGIELRAYSTLHALRSITIEIPGDFSSAAYFIAVGLLIPGSEITIRNVGLNPYRIGLLKILKKMGARVSQISNLKSQIPNSEPAGDIIVRHSFLKGVTVSGKIIPSIIDEVPILALIATQAEGRTIIKGASELRVKESDRIKTVRQELSKLGADIKETADGMIIKGPTKLFGANCSSHNDHRIALMLNIAGLITQGKIKIENNRVINKSFPSFYTFLRKLGVSG